MKAIKTTIIDCEMERISEQIRNAEVGRRDAEQEAAAHKGAMASRYDTFKEEAQYKAAGYARQIQELDRVLSAFRNLKMNPPAIRKGSIYSIIELKDCDSGEEKKYFLLPAGGGMVYRVEGEEIAVLTVGSPLALALIGATPGSLVEAPAEGTTKSFAVISVR